MSAQNAAIDTDTGSEAPRDLGLTYMQAMHAIQSGVAHEHSRGSDDGSAKHLRVGVNSSQINSVALASLLINKGIITAAEYEEAVRLWANEEVATYQDRANGGPGNPQVITFR